MAWCALLGWQSPAFLLSPLTGFHRTQHFRQWQCEGSCTLCACPLPSPYSICSCSTWVSPFLCTIHAFPTSVGYFYYLLSCVRLFLHTLLTWPPCQPSFMLPSPTTTATHQTTMLPPVVPLYPCTCTGGVVTLQKLFDHTLFLPTTKLHLHTFGHFLLALHLYYLNVKYNGDGDSGRQWPGRRAGTGMA